jgi:putative drug exporter of the RND superfamily
MLERLARFIDRRRRAVLVASVLVVFAAGAFGGPVVGLLDVGDDFSDPQSESIQARDTIERTTGRSAAPDAVVLARLGAEVGTPEADRRLAAVRERVQDGDVASIGAPEPGSPLVSRDRRSVYLPVTFYTAADEDAAGEALVERMRGEPGATVGGGIVAFDQVGDQVEADLQRAEMLAAPILLLFSLLVFRSLVAALLPLAVGTATVLLTFSGLRIINSFEPMSTFAINLTTGLGLGLAIDYSLFMVSRFREELEADGDRSRALRATVRTAGRTVLFSAFTVAAALAAMLVFPLRFLYSMGAGGVLVALSAAFVSLTLLPALLAVLGPRVNALGLRRWQVAMRRDAAHVRAGPWYRLSRAVMRRPGPVAVSAATLLIVMGLPFLRIEFTGVDASVLPHDKSAKVVDEALRAEFPPGPTAPVLVAAGVGERGRPAAEDYARRLAAVDGVAGVSPPEQAGGYWLYSVVPEGPALSDEAKEVVRDVRDLGVPFPVQVGGETAGFLDQQTSLGDSLPLALAIIATTTLVILFAMTGSVVLPVKALVMNLLTVCAAFGLLVLIFQDGRLEGLLAYDSQRALEATQPVLLFCVAFGLSTDYGVFLLTRIKEARDGGAGERESVAIGLERTGRIVTYAALLFCVAIGAFATSEVVFIKEVGVGTALAVLIDAFIVRALLVPSLMALLGHRNWWAPRPLARLHARLGLQEA